MLELIITGGMGNQMFQYACARNIQIMTGEEVLIINTSLFKTDGFGREYSLDACNLPQDKVKVIDRPAKLVRYIGGISNNASSLVYDIMSKLGIYIWKKREFKKIECNKKNSKLFGYFQSEQYFSSNSDIIKQELKIKKPISEDNQKWIDEIRRTNAVCLHIRRGDYIKENLIVCDENYYWNAIEYIKEREMQPIFYVFSDDIEWVKEHYKDDSFRYVDNHNSDYDELRLMYSCKHFIMSNSSFSWWAQYLSDFEKGIVIAPKKWLPDDPVQDIYMNSWVVLD